MLSIRRTRLLLVVSEGYVQDPEQNPRFLSRLPFSGEDPELPVPRSVLDGATRLLETGDSRVIHLNVEDEEDAPAPWLSEKLLRQARRPVLHRRARAEAWRRVEARHLRLLARAADTTAVPGTVVARVDAVARTAEFARTQSSLDRAFILVDDTAARLALQFRPETTIFAAAGEDGGDRGWHWRATRALPDCPPAELPRLVRRLAEGPHP